MKIILKLKDKKSIYKINNAPMRFLDKKQYIKMLKKIIFLLLFRGIN